MKLRVVRESSSLRTGVALVAAAAVLGAFPSAGSTRGTGASVAATPKLGPVQHAHANGIDIGYRVGGRGPWLVMVKASPKQVSRAPSSEHRFRGKHSSAPAIGTNRGVANPIARWCSSGQ